MFLKSPHLLTHAYFTNDQRKIGLLLPQSLYVCGFVVIFSLQELLRRFFIPKKTTPSSKEAMPELLIRANPGLKRSPISLKPELRAQISQPLCPCFKRMGLDSLRTLFTFILTTRRHLPSRDGCGRAGLTLPQRCTVRDFKVGS